MFDRLAINHDIVSVEFNIDASDRIEHYDFFVDWIGESFLTNEAQDNYISKNGNLYIVIADKKKIADFFFNDEEISNKK